MDKKLELTFAITNEHKADLTESPVTPETAKVQPWRGVLREEVSRSGGNKQLDFKLWVQAGSLCFAGDSYPVCFLSVLLSFSLISFLWRSLDSSLSMFCFRQFFKQFYLAFLNNSLDSSSPADPKSSPLFCTSIQSFTPGFLLIFKNQHELVSGDPNLLMIWRLQAYIFI